MPLTGPICDQWVWWRNASSLSVFVKRKGLASSLKPYSSYLRRRRVEAVNHRAFTVHLLECWIVTESHWTHACNICVFEGFWLRMITMNDEWGLMKNASRLPLCQRWWNFHDLRRETAGMSLCAVRLDCVYNQRFEITLAEGWFEEPPFVLYFLIVWQQMQHRSDMLACWLLKSGVKWPFKSVCQREENLYFSN